MFSEADHRPAPNRFAGAAATVRPATGTHLPVRPQPTGAMTRPTCAPGKKGIA
ncbi:hypothetical protein GCM10009850_117520 [Nonomuraea monospora]|uniref:Uncharacterized protein n=1 Tax=Nonomuraea monospora TaxID=568818 RepID=A0ABP5PX76_9ACTN